MAKITTRPNVNLDLTFTINESEARALDALAGYGDDSFIKAFKSYYNGTRPGVLKWAKDEEFPTI
jgi:hypothetical protein